MEQMQQLVNREGGDTSEETCDPEAWCFFAARRKGEPTFTLRAQDATAPALVECWAYAQVFLKIRMDAGMTMAEAVEKLRERILMVLGIDEFISAEVLADLPKVSGAFEKAGLMYQWPNRRVAD